MCVLKPFLKWVGGKQQLRHDLLSLAPLQSSIPCYVEPFLGGGALFFALHSRIEKAVLVDKNADLILCYNIVKNHVDALIHVLKDLQERYQTQNKAAFLDVKDAFNAPYDASSLTARVARAGQLIFLNKTCFNGLYRVNKQGLFNVPFGGYIKPLICDEVKLLAASKALQKATLICADYSESIRYIDQDNAFVYCDPPYRPLTSTSSFTSYTGHAFDDNEQKRLAQFIKQISLRKNLWVMLSNSDASQINANDTFFEDLYQGFVFHRVKARRNVNCKGNKRGKITELIITNYQTNEHHSMATDF